MIHKKYIKSIRPWEAVIENRVKLNINIFGREFANLGIYGIGEDENIVAKELIYEMLNNLNKIRNCIK